MVKKAIENREYLKEKCLKEIDSVWVVFDKDDADKNDTKRKNFAEAFAIAEEEKMKVAYSNEVFELWLLLHFKDVERNSPIPRAKIYVDLENEIKAFEGCASFEYVHGNPEVVDMVIRLGNEEEAISRAKNLMAYHEGKEPIEANPSTKIYELVAELRGWIKYHTYEP